MPSIYSLIERGRRADFEALLTEHPELVRDRGSYGDTPLHIAAWQNRAKMLQRLLELGADIDARGDRGFSPLHYAARHGSVKSAHILVERGANLDAHDDQGFRPIHTALRGREQQSLTIADLLETAGAKVDLSCHVMRGDEAKVRQTLTQNPATLQEGPLARDLIYDAVLWILSQTDYARNFAERSVLARQHRGLLDALLDAGANVNDFKWSGESALQQARTAHNPFLIELLEEHGAKL